MKIRYTFISSAIALALLSGCSGKDKLSQADSSFAYLDISQASELKQDPDNAIPTSKVYVLPTAKVHGNLGQAVDITPPVEILEVISGTRSQYRNDQVLVWMSSAKQLTDVWDSILKAMQQDNVALVKHTDSVIESDWVDLQQEIVVADNVKSEAEEEDDDDTVLPESLVRYRVEKMTNMAQKGLKISLLDWKAVAEDAPQLTTESGRRYTISAANQFLTYYDIEKRREAQRKAQDIMRKIPMQMGVDTSALPIIIARIPFEVFWERLPSLLPRIGMHLEDKSRSQGTMDVEYFSPSETEWAKLGMQGWRIDELDRHSFQLHMGDLKNRTSISLTDMDGKPVSEDMLQSFMLGLRASVDYDNRQALEAK